MKIKDATTPPPKQVNLQGRLRKYDFAGIKKGTCREFSELESQRAGNNLRDALFSWRRLNHPERRYTTRVEWYLANPSGKKFWRVTIWRIEDGE